MDKFPSLAAGESMSVTELRSMWEELGGDFGGLSKKPHLKEMLVDQQRQVSAMSDTDALNRWQAQLKHLMHVAATADIFVKSLNDSMHKNKAKELEVYM
jgi:hypothetical protein